LFRIKFGIRARVLIVLIIKRSICLCLIKFLAIHNPRCSGIFSVIWKKKCPVLISGKKKTLLIIKTTIWKFPMAAPQPNSSSPLTMINLSSSHHFAPAISHSRSISDNNHNQSSTASELSSSRVTVGTNRRSLSSATNKITQQPPSVPAIVFVFSSHASFYSRHQQQQEGNSATTEDARGKIN